MKITNDAKYWIHDLEAISKETHQIAHGNLEIDPIHTKSEKLGGIADDINDIADTLNNYIGEISRVLSHVSIGNLLVQVSNDLEYYGDFIPIKTALEKLLSSFSGAFKEISNIMDEINHIGEQTNIASNRVAENETELAFHMQNVHTKMDDIYDKAEQNTCNVTEVNKSITTTIDTAKQGDTNINKLIHSMQEVNRSSNNISHITDMILDISSQTKLLSLNASIEAARAGELGRGFSVVAEEIGKLAIQTTDAVAQAGELIAASIDNVNECESIVRDTANCFASIHHSIEEVSFQCENIQTTTIDQQANIKDIVHIIEDVTNTISDNAALAQESASANTCLYEETEKLASLLGRFVIDEKKKIITDKKTIQKSALAFIDKVSIALTDSEPDTLNHMLSANINKYECVECAYIIDADGIQISNTILSPQINQDTLGNFHPSVPGDNHKSKKYFTQAIRKNGEVFESSEYISSATGGLCSTFSQVCMHTNGTIYILCVDTKY